MMNNFKNNLDFFKNMIKVNKINQQHRLNKVARHLYKLNKEQVQSLSVLKKLKLLKHYNKIKMISSQIFN